MLIEGAYTELYWQLTCPSRCSLWFSTSVKTKAVILLHLYLYAWLLRTLWNTVGPSNICKRGAGACMGGQMPRRRPNQLSGPSVSHPIGEAVQHEVTRSRGRIENNKRISIKSFFYDIMQTWQGKKTSKRGYGRFFCVRSYVFKG